MKKFIILLLLITPTFLKAQAHLGNTAKEIEDLFPTNTFKSDVTALGKKYIYTGMDLGTFTYYFDSTGHSDLCILLPNDMFKVNQQVQTLNHEYVITSDTTWKAYLDGGYIMNIKLSYNAEYKISSFSYTPN